MGAVSLATKGIISSAFVSQEAPIYYYSCVDLPEILAAKNMSPDIEVKAIGVKIVMTDLGPHTPADDSVAEKSIKSLIPKLTIK